MTICPFQKIFITKGFLIKNKLASVEDLGYSKITLSITDKLKMIIRGQTFALLKSLSNDELEKIMELIVEQEPLCELNPNSPKIQKLYYRSYLAVLKEQRIRNK